MAQPTGQAATIAQPEPVAQLPAARSRAGGVMAIVPQSWQEVVAIAGAICRANMAPKSYCKVDGYGKLIYVDGKPVPEPEKVAIGIMHGMEVGLTPMAALQSIAVINGMPSLYGDGLMGVVRASGLLEDLEEGIQVDKDDRPTIAWCKVKRRGESTWKERELTYVECVRAGWTKKDGPWTYTPARMMTVRVRGWLLRDMFADVLRGLHSAEEMEDMVDVTPQSSATMAQPAEAAPKREDFTDKSKESAPPAEQKKEAPADEKKPRPSRRKKEDTGKPPYDEKANAEATRREQAAAAGITDVVDQNDGKITFQEFNTAKDFFEFSEKWLAEEGRTADEAKQWEAFYREQMARIAKLTPESAQSEKTKASYAKLQEALADAMVQYNLILSKAEAPVEAQREPGEEG